MSTEASRHRTGLRPAVTHIVQTGLLGWLALLAGCQSPTEKPVPPPAPALPAPAPSTPPPAEAIERFAEKTPVTTQEAEAPADSPDNLLANPGFESGVSPWIFLFPDAPFSVTSSVAHGGRSSALIQLRGSAADRGARVYMVTQEIAPPELPEVISGYYRVESWEKDTPKQYLQCAVVVFGATNMPEHPNHQLRYILCGIDEEPFLIRNAHFVFLDREEPREGTWIPFRCDLRRDFLRLWGALPEGFRTVRILFEARYDDKQPGSATSGDVYFDDLYAGPTKDTISE